MGRSKEKSCYKIRIPPICAWRSRGVGAAAGCCRRTGWLVVKPRLVVLEAILEGFRDQIAATEGGERRHLFGFVGAVHMLVLEAILSLGGPAFALTSDAASIVELGRVGVDVSRRGHGAVDDPPGFGIDLLGAFAEEQQHLKEAQTSGFEGLPSVLTAYSFFHLANAAVIGRCDAFEARNGVFAVRSTRDAMSIAVESGTVTGVDVTLRRNQVRSCFLCF